MRHTRTIVTLVIALAGAVQGLGAQTQTRFGPMGGVAVSNFHGADVGSGVNSRTSFAVGAFATFGISKNFAVEPQAFYIEKGATVDVGGGVTGTFKVHYIEVPLLFKLVFPMEGKITPNLFAGPAVAFRTTCKLQADSAGVTSEANCSDVGAAIKSTDFIAAFGAGVDIGPVAIQGRYDLGLTKIDDTSSPADVKNKTWLFTAGLRLPLK